MNSLLVAFSVVVPIFLYLFLGVFLKWKKTLDIHSLNYMNKISFKVFLAVSLYYNIYITDIKKMFNLRLIIYALVTQVLIFIISIIAGLVTERDITRIGALSHSIYHTNFVIFGTSIGSVLCGENNLGTISLLIAFVVPIQNLFSVILLEYCKKNRTDNLIKLSIGVFKNPYVFSAILAFLTHFLGISFPQFIVHFIRDLGRCGSPIALITMGGLFNFTSIKGNRKTILFGTIMKLLIIPLIFIPITIKLGFTGPAFVGLMSIFIGPCATSSFNLASMMDSDADLTGQIIVSTTALSMLTIFAWVFILDLIGVLV